MMATDEESTPQQCSSGSPDAIAPSDQESELEDTAVTSKQQQPRDAVISSEQAEVKTRQELVNHGASSTGCSPSLLCNSPERQNAPTSREHDSEPHCSFDHDFTSITSPSASRSGQAARSPVLGPPPAAVTGRDRRTTRNYTEKTTSFSISRGDQHSGFMAMATTHRDLLQSASSITAEQRASNVHPRSVDGATLALATMKNGEAHPARSVSAGAVSPMDCAAGIALHPPSSSSAVEAAAPTHEQGLTSMPPPTSPDVTLDTFSVPRQPPSIQQASSHGQKALWAARICDRRRSHAR